MDPNHATETQEFIVLTTECWSTHTVIHVLYNDGFSYDDLVRSVYGIPYSIYMVYLTDSLLTY